ncbi:unnamed protein product [Nesidiocoris tenuis]|uniref:Uncharacterized protein n=1 Tax=Nesidiocoris tenuis TaxID=355587 RepID=A0A6H5GZ81_9HEMI|nr:unnamed protein product [Nesidiocoris tenuis]
MKGEDSQRSLLRGSRKMDEVSRSGQGGKIIIKLMQISCFKLPEIAPYVIRCLSGNFSTNHRVASRYYTKHLSTANELAERRRGAERDEWRVRTIVPPAFDPLTVILINNRQWPCFPVLWEERLRENGRDNTGGKQFGAAGATASRHRSQKVLITLIEREEALVISTQNTFLHNRSSGSLGLNLAEGGIGSGFPYAYQLGSDIETNELLAMKLSGPEFGNVHHDTAEEFDDTTNSVSMSPTIPRIALDRELAGPSEIRKHLPNKRNRLGSQLARERKRSGESSVGTNGNVSIGESDRFRPHFPTTGLVRNSREALHSWRWRWRWDLMGRAWDAGLLYKGLRAFGDKNSCHLLQCPGQLRIVDIRIPCSSFSVPSEFKYLIPERRERSGGRTSCDHETRVNRTGSKPRLTRIPSGAWRQEKHPSSALQEEDLPPPGWTRRPANARGTAAIIT